MRDKREHVANGGIKLMAEIKATKAEIAKLKSDLAVRGLRNLIEGLSGYLYYEHIDQMKTAVELLVKRYGEPKEAGKK